MRLQNLWQQSKLHMLGLFFVLISLGILFQNCAGETDMSIYTQDSGSTGGDGSGGGSTVTPPPPNAPTISLQLKAYDSATQLNVVTAPEGTSLFLRAEHLSVQGTFTYSFSVIRNGQNMALATGANNTHSLGVVSLADNGAVYKVIAGLNNEFNYEATYTLSVSRVPIVLEKVNCGDTSFHNEFGSSVGTAPDWEVKYQAPENYFVFGEYSIFSSTYKDRRFRNYQCQMRDSRLGVFVKSETTAHPNDRNFLNGYAANINFTCPVNKFLTGQDSVFYGSDVGDRRYRYYCSSMKNPQTNVSAQTANCTWSGYTNPFNVTVNYRCPDSKVMAGVQSRFSLCDDFGACDRQYNFYCCDAVPAQ